MNANKNLLALMAALLSLGAVHPVMAQESETSVTLEEILVTATRRATSLNDTAISAVVVGEEEISRRNLSGMNDYLRTIPGINLIDQGVGSNAVIIRGVSVDPQQEGFQSSPTTGVYFGEVSIGGAGPGSGNPDLRMIDLERVEVLRGPQGTVFGSSALAGAVRNIPNAPNLQEFEGSIRTSYSATAKAGGDNTRLEGVVNIPLIDNVLAIRAVAYSHDNSGYINNIAGTQLAANGPLTTTYTAGDAVAAFGSADLYQDQDNVGNNTYSGARVAVLWAPVDELNVTLQFVQQDAEQAGGTYEQLNLGNYTQAVLQYGNNVPSDGFGLTDDLSITNLVAEYDLGWATLLSSSSWLDDKSELNNDVSSFLGGSPTSQLNHSSYDSFTEELRMVSQLDGAFQYVVGLFYEDTENNNDQDIYATGDLALNLLGTPFGNTNPLLVDQFTNRTLEQFAIYGELTYELTERLSLTGGARHFDYERDQEYFLTGAFGDSEASGKLDEAGTNFKANLSYQANDDTLVYAQWAEGFRLGNVTTAPPPAICDVDNDGILDGTNTPINPFFDSDGTESFEVGAKAGLQDNRLQINVAAYQIDWQNIPLRVFSPAPCNGGLTANAGDARSQGLEIETTYQLSENLRINLGGGYTNAELTAVAPGVSSSFSIGDRLPSSPEYSGNLGFQYEFELGGNATYIQGDYAYVGEFFNMAGETGDKGGDYNQLNMSAGIALDQFNLELFAHNLTDEDAVTSVGVLAPDNRAYRLRPRTVGLNVSYQF